MEDSDPFGEAFESAISDVELFGHEGACPLAHEAGDPRIILITGENAGGKSFFAKAIASYLHHQHPKAVEVISVSMGMRTSPGMHRAFMFGEEGRDSTGKISLRAVLGGLHTCKGRDNPHVLVLDEPDIGLSEGYRAGLGDLLTEFGRDLPQHTRALIVVTHSRAVAGKLTALNPTCLRIGDDHRPTAEWIRHGDPVRSAADIEELAMKATLRMRAIQAVLNDRQAVRASKPPGP